MKKTVSLKDFQRFILALIGTLLPVKKYIRKWGRDIERYNVPMNYDAEVGEYLHGYDDVDLDITSLDVPTNRSGEVEIIMEVISPNLGWRVSWREGMDYLSARNLRLAEPRELLALVKEHPEVRFKFSRILAMGGFWYYFSKTRYEIWVMGNKVERTASLLNWLEWPVNIPIAVVHK